MSISRSSHRKRCWRLRNITWSPTQSVYCSLEIHSLPDSVAALFTLLKSCPLTAAKVMTNLAELWLQTEFSWSLACADAAGEYDCAQRLGS